MAAADAADAPLDVRCAAILNHIVAHDTGPRKVGRLVAFDGLTLVATGLALPAGAIVDVGCISGRTSPAEVVGFKGERTLLTALDHGAFYEQGSPVVPASGCNDVPVGPALLGRVIDALGRPLDGKGAIMASERWPLLGHKDNPLNRGSVTERLDLGVRAINALLTAGVGQRIAIIAGSGVGKSVLLGQILAGVDADVIVVGLVGERGREVSDFLNERLSVHIRTKSVVVAVPADRAPMLRLRAAMRATAVAEYFRAKGKRVLLLIDSLTRVAHAQREIGLSMGEPPTVKGYPPSALGLIPRLVERAGVDVRSGGSITAIYTVLADGDDTDDPIVDAARAIVDGHIILSRALAEQGVYPAIDISKSISRVMADIVTTEHRARAAALRGFWSAYESNRDLVLMGAYAAGSDAVIDQAIARRPAILNFLRQEQDESCRFDASLDMLQAVAAP